VGSGLAVLSRLSTTCLTKRNGQEALQNASAGDEPPSSSCLSDTPPLLPPLSLPVSRRGPSLLPPLRRRLVAALLARYGSNSRPSFTRLHERL
jgi:hypothetical protein